MTDDKKKEFLSVMWALEHSGALAQIGDPAASVDRVSHAQLAGMLGVSRETVTKRIAEVTAWREDGCANCQDTEGKHRFPCTCSCHNFDPNWPEARRDKHSARMRLVTARHPHWKGAPEAGSSPLGTTASGALNRSQRRRRRREGTRSERRIRRHIACILTHNPAFGAANSYHLTMPESARPTIAAGQNHAAIAATHFGVSTFAPDARWSGFRKSVGMLFHPKMPDAATCVCRLGQRKLSFQKVCPKCEGKGFILGGSMPDNCRIFLQFLHDRGINEEIRSCRKCKRTFSEKCPGCGTKEGEIVKHRGVLEGWTEEAIGKAIGQHPSTLRKWIKVARRLMLLRTAPGRVYRHCSRCDKNFSGQCSTCGSQAGPVVRRDAQKYLWISARILDREIARSERSRLEAILAAHSAYLEAKQRHQMAQAVELALKVLSEWQGHEHRLESFWNEMRRQLAATPWLMNVLFPLKT